MNIKCLIKRPFVHMECLFTKRDKNLWLFGEWFGNKVCDNSFFLANYIAEKHPEIDIYWAANKGTDTSKLHDNIHVVDRHAPSTIKIYKSAGYVFMNQGLQDFSDDMYNYFSGAVTVNLWHGVPWKKIMIDSFDRKNMMLFQANKIFFNLNKAKYFLSLSKVFDNIYKESAGLGKRRIIHAGYPRNSLFYDDSFKIESKKRIVSQIKDANPKAIIDANTRIIAYMPTFRDSNSDVFSFNDMGASKKAEHDFYQYLRGENIVLVEKCHYVSSDRKKQSESSSDNNQKNEGADAGDKLKMGTIVNLPNCDAAELLAASDMLITDYSSCFFDYLVLDRPIVHYIYDYDFYSTKDRGLYFPKEMVMCGDAAETPEELIDAIKTNLRAPDKNKELRRRRKRQFMTFETPNCCERIYKIVKKIKR